MSGRLTALRNSAWVTLRYATTSIGGFIVSLGFAHFGSKETLGQYQVILSTMALFSFLTLPGLNMAAIKAITQKKMSAVVEAVNYSLRWSLIALPLLVGYGIWQITLHQPVFGWALVISGLFFPLYYGPNTWYVFYEGQSLFRPVAIRTIIATAVTSAALLGALLLGWNVFLLVTVFLVVSTAFTVYYYLEVRRLVSSDTSQPQSRALDFGYGLRVSVQKSAYTISESLPPLAIGFTLGHASVAVFQIANVFLGAIAGFIGALAAVTLPTIFSGTGSSQVVIFRQTVVTGLISSLGYYVIVRLLFGYFYGADYQVSYQIALALVALPMIVALRTFVINFFTAAERNGIIVIIYGLANVVGLAVFLGIVHRTSLVVATSSYLYILNLAITLPLLGLYLVRHGKSEALSFGRNPGRVGSNKV